jgi:hypothetical protein
MQLRPVLFWADCKQNFGAQPPLCLSLQTGINLIPLPQQYMVP